MANITEKNNESCKRHFNLWVAFIFGMSIALIAFVLFDKFVFSSSQTRVGVTTTTTPVVLAAGEATPYLGLQVLDLDENIIKTLNLKSNDGVLVGKVIKASPADQAGILPGDVILKFDRQKVKDVATFKQLVAETAIGDRVKVGLVRASGRESVYVLVAAKPLSAAILTADTPTMLGTIGITVSPLTASFVQQYGVATSTQGVGIIAVTPGSKADAAGLLPGDVITSVNKTEVADIGAFITALGSGNTALLGVTRGTEESYVTISSTTPLSVVPGPNSSGGLRRGATPTGGSPFTTDTDTTTDDEEGGYQGKPETLPPQSTSVAGTTDVCKCLYCGSTLVHPVGVPCTTIKCPNCGNFMVSSNSLLLNVSGMPETIPPMGNPNDAQQTAYTIVALPVAGMPTAGMPTAGMPTAGMPTAGMPTAGMPTAGMPTAGMPTAGMPTAGMPTAGMPTAGMPTAGMPTAGMPTAGMPTAGMPTAGMPTAGMPTAGMPTAGMPTAGMPTAGMPTAGMPTAGMPTAGMPTAGRPTAGVSTAGMPTTGVLVAGNSPTTSGAQGQQGRTDVCVCLVCGASVVHPAGVQCVQLTCPSCGTPLVSGTAILKTSSKPETIPPMGSPTAGTATAGTPTAGTKTAGTKTAGSIM